MPVRLVLSVGLFAGVANVADAAPMSSDAEVALQQHCMGDFTTVCGDMPPEDGPENQECFEKNMAKLSPGCQGAIQSYKKG